MATNPEEPETPASRLYELREAAGVAWGDVRVGLKSNKRRILFLVTALLTISVFAPLAVVPLMWLALGDESIAY